jgi:hypothetical protein
MFSFRLTTMNCKPYAPYDLFVSSNATMAGKLQPLDFSSIKDKIIGPFLCLQSNILNVLVSLLQSADEDIHDAVKEIIKLYLGAQPLGPDGIYNADGAIEAYDSQTFF